MQNFTTDDIIEFLSLEIPIKEDTSDGFLEIIRMQHNENINSRLYQYFLNLESCSSIFIDSLLELIEYKTSKQLTVKNFTVETEVKTKNKKRIDIYINDKKSRSAIIIENKIYHNLNNDLEEYWNFCSYKPKRKIGVLLTLEKLGTAYFDNRFVNITHREWINKIEEKGLPTGLPYKTYIYLNDFFNSIKNLTEDMNMSDSARFYFQHTKKINRAFRTKNDAVDFVVNQISITAEKLNLQVYGSSRGWRNIWDEENDWQTFYTIIFDQLFTSKKTVEIIIESQQEDMSLIPDFKKLLKQNDLLKNFEVNEIPSRDYIHFLKRSYKLEITDIETLGEFLYQKILSDFAPTMSLLVDRINNQK